MPKITPQLADRRDFSYDVSGSAINIGIMGTGASGEAVPQNMVRSVIRAAFAPSQPQSGLTSITVQRRDGTTDTQVDQQWVGHMSGIEANPIEKVGTINEPVYSFIGSSYIRVFSGSAAVVVSMGIVDLPR